MNPIDEYNNMFKVEAPQYPYEFTDGRVSSPYSPDDESATYDEAISRLIDEPRGCALYLEIGKEGSLLTLEGAERLAEYLFNTCKYIRYRVENDEQKEINGPPRKTSTAYHSGAGYMRCDTCGGRCDYNEDGELVCIECDALIVYNQK